MMRFESQAVTAQQHHGDLEFPLVLVAEGLMSQQGLHAQSAALMKQLATHGVILFRGCGVTDAQAFIRSRRRLCLRQERKWQEQLKRCAMKLKWRVGRKPMARQKFSPMRRGLAVRLADGLYERVGSEAAAAERAVRLHDDAALLVLGDDRLRRVAAEAHAVWQLVARGRRRKLLVVEQHVEL